MPRLKHLNNKDPWMLGEQIPDCDLFFSQIWLTCFVNQFKYPSGRNYQKMLTVYKGYNLWFYFGKQDSFDEGEYIANKFIKNPTFATKINKQIIVEADKLRNFANQLPQEHLSKLTNKQLWDLYNKHHQIHAKYYQWCWIPVGVDMFHNNLTERLKKYLRSINVTEDKINEYLVILTQPTKKSLIQVEEEDFLKIAIDIYKNKKQKRLFASYFNLLKKEATLKLELNVHTPEYESFLEQRMTDLRDKIDPVILKKLEKYYNNYFYVKFMWIGKEGVTSFEHYLKEMARFIGSGIDPKKSLQKQQREFNNALNKRKQLIKKLKVKNPWRTIIDSWGSFMVTKIYRRYAQIYAMYRMQPVLEEIAKRLKTTVKEVKFMLVQEVGSSLKGKMISRKELKERTKLCVFYTEKNNDKIFIGKQAKKIISQLEKKKKSTSNIINGQTGCIGRAKGKVKIVIRPKDMTKMNKGDILVSIATDPDIVPAMKKAAAIVTDQGGITSHAAIVSREMNIPCVIGTKMATESLKDGDMVEVDANKGTVKKI